MKKLVFISLIGLLGHVSYVYASPMELVLRDRLEKVCIDSMKSRVNSGGSKNYNKICNCYADKHYEIAKKDSSPNFEDRVEAMKWSIKILETSSYAEKDAMEAANPALSDLDYDIAMDCYNLYK